jgi:pyruvate/2-oxoglutarate/acetoin dehydrogenase E1 component
MNAVSRPTDARTLTFREALNEALREEMARDERVIILGEDVGRKGGIAGVTRGLLEQFGPSRVIDTPISEMAIAGACSGAAMSGLRPVGEFYYCDMLMFMADNVVTSAARLHFATGSRAPYVLRGRDGSKPEDGGPHQDSLAAWFAHVPGLKVIMPSTPADAKGLLISAIRDDNPVVFLEQIPLYNVTGEVPAGEYTVPIGKAEIRAAGTDVTVACIGRCVHDALQARGRWADKGVSIEVLDLRSLRPLDTEAIRASVARTGRLVTVHEGWASYGIGAEVVACVSDGPRLLLKAPACRVGTMETHIPASPRLAAAVLPNAKRIDDAIAAVMGQG